MENEFSDLIEAISQVGGPIASAVSRLSDRWRYRSCRAQGSCREGRSLVGITSQDSLPVAVSLTFSPDSSHLAAGTRTGRVIVFDVVRAQVIGDWEARIGERDRVIGAADRMLSNLGADTVQSLMLAAAMSHRLSVHSVAISPAGLLLCAALGNGQIDFRSLRGRHIRSWSTGSKSLRYVAYDEQAQALTYLTDESLITKLAASNTSEVNKIACQHVSAGAAWVRCGTRRIA